MEGAAARGVEARRGAPDLQEHVEEDLLGELAVADDAQGEGEDLAVAAIVELGQGRLASLRDGGQEPLHLARRARKRGPAIDRGRTRHWKECTQPTAFADSWILRIPSRIQGA